MTREERDTAIEILNNNSIRDRAWRDALKLAVEALKAEPCEDAVSRQAVLDLINADWKYEGLEVPVASLPSVTPKQKTGNWVSDLKAYGYGKDDYHCSICGRDIHLCRPHEQLKDYPYCHCGAKMVESYESENKE